jgi:microcystin-dependent protein
MSNPYIGEIRMFGGNFAPIGWAFCNGQLLPISENEALFNLIGTTYGGDGQETFALPDLRGRVPVHQGTGPGLSSRIIGEIAGNEQVTLTTNQMPIHTHPFLADNSAANSANANGHTFGVAQGDVYSSSVTPITMAAQGISAMGGSQPHDNTQPYLCISFIISLYGIFPSPT